MNQRHPRLALIADEHLEPRRLLAATVVQSTDDAEPQALTDVNGTLFFFNESATAYEWELWKTDGTAEGTTRIKNFSLGEQQSAEDMELTNVNGTLFFTAGDESTDGKVLWKSDGTAEGTVVVKDIDDTTGAGPGELTNFNGTLYFTNHTEGIDLWKSDGTTERLCSLSSVLQRVVLVP